MRHALGITVMLACALGAVEPLTLQADTPAQATPHPTLSWEELSATPTRYLGQRVELVVQLKSEVAAWNPYVTRFGQRDWHAWQAWSDAQLPWHKEQYDTPQVRVFARRAGASAWALEQTQPHTRVTLRVRVCEVFLGEPWCEVEAVVPCVEDVGEASVIHAARGLAEARLGRHELAVHAYDEALKAPLPAHARRELQQHRAEALQAAAAARESGSSGSRDSAATGTHRPN